MPGIKIKDPDSGTTYDMPWSGSEDPTTADIDYFLKQKKGGSGIFGPVKEALGKARDWAVSPLLPEASGGKTDTYVGSKTPIIRDIWPGGIKVPNMRDAYDEIARPLSSPAGIASSLLGGYIGRRATNSNNTRINADALKAQEGERLGTERILQPYNQPTRTALPPAPNQPRFYAGQAGIAEQGKPYPSDLGPISPRIGQRVQDISKTGQTGPDYPVTVLPRETEGLANLPAIDAARLGTTRGEIPKFRYDSPSDVLGSMERMKTSPMELTLPDKKDRVNLPKPKPEPTPYTNKPAGDDFSIGEFPKPTARKFGSTLGEYKGTKPNEPSTNVDTTNMGRIRLPNEDEIYKLSNQDPRNWGEGTIGTKVPENIKENKTPIRQTLDEHKQKAQISATAEDAGAEAMAQLESKGNGISNYTPYRPIATDASPKDAIKQWADGTVSGAKYRGQFMAERFKDLDSPELIHKFEAGDKTGRLKDVQTYFDTRWNQAKELGLLSEDQKRLNYLRHYFQQSPEEVKAALKTYVGKNPQFAKEGRFPTYQAAEGSGLTPKYNNISEIVGAYETEFNRAIRKKELYDYLGETGIIKKGTTISSDMNDWQFTTKGLQPIDRFDNTAKDLINNVMSKSKGVLGAAADIGSMTKNIYLGGGVAGTKWNMHAWNIFRNDFSTSGPISALKKMFSDPTGNRAVKWYQSLPTSEKDILADLSDRGWQGKPVSDIGESVNLPSKLAEKTTNTAGKAVLQGAGKVLEGSQNLFEKPLFDKALPALNAQRALEAFHSLVQKGMAKEDALKSAAQIGNDFYGGIDKVLRNATNRDLGRVAILAPDWLESQVTKAYHQWKGLGKVVTGQANPADKYYAKSLGRSAMIPSIGGVSALATGAKLLGNNRQRDIGAVNLGALPSGKTRELPTLTTANEELRTPIVAPIEMYKGNPAALKDILLKNRISTPLNTVIDLVRGEDRYGNPLSGADKYGKKISGPQAALNYAKESTRPFQHQMIQGLVSWLKGDITAEEAAVMGLELPLAYSSPQKEKRAPISGPRISIPNTMR